MIVYSTCRDCDGLLLVNGPFTEQPSCTHLHGCGKQHLHVEGEGRCAECSLHIATQGHRSCCERGTPQPCHPRPTKVERLAQEYLAAVEAQRDIAALGMKYDIDELDDQPPRMLDAALRYAAWGWPVFPLKTTAMAQQAHDPYKASKTPATKNGFKDATTDLDQIRKWWERSPDSGIGLATGHAFDVLDIDVYAEGGFASYLKIIEQNHFVHGQVATASSGVHFYIRPSGQGNRTRMRPGVDFRGLGGYVIAPPTRLLGERRWTYGWVFRPSPAITGGEHVGR